jgi:hypothetical protein
MGLRLRRSRLQLGPHAESIDSSDVSQGRSLSAGFEKGSSAYQQMQPKLLYLSQNRETGKGSESHHPFFRSLLLLYIRA